MQQDDEIEILLWDYIDGRCNAAEQQRIKNLIETNSTWKQKFGEFSLLHQSIHPDLEHPSMRFAKNVMDTVAKTQIAPPTRKYINHYIVRGIAVFFIVSIISILGYALLTTNWDSDYYRSSPPFNAGLLHLNVLLSSNLIYTFILINIILGLVLIDSILRRKRSTLEY